MWSTINAILVKARELFNGSTSEVFSNINNVHLVISNANRIRKKIVIKSDLKTNVYIIKNDNPQISTVSVWYDHTPIEVKFVDFIWDNFKLVLIKFRQSIQGGTR